MPQWLRYESANAVAAACISIILDNSSKAITERGLFRIVLAGGTTPMHVYEGLQNADTDWSAWRIYFSDERCLDEDDPERNSVMAWDSWLKHVDIPADNIFSIPAHLGAGPAASKYAEVISQALPFDLVLLGMGEDGHTASLFPGHKHNDKELVHAVHNAPKWPPDRVTLSAAALADTRELLVLVTGAGKSNAVSRWLSGEPLPVSELPSPAMRVLIDEEAWPLPD